MVFKKDLSYKSLYFEGYETVPTLCLKTKWFFMYINTDHDVKEWDCAKKKIKEKKNFSLVRVRVELTTLALSAPRSADWANGPAMVN